MPTLEIAPRGLGPFLLALLLTAPAALAGQDLPSGYDMRERVPATVVLADEIEPELSAELSHPGATGWILRRTAAQPADVVVLRSGEADPARLSAALMTLLVARDLLGDAPEEDAVIPVLKATGPRAWRGRNMTTIARVLKDLREAEPRPIFGIGEGRHVTVWLPAEYDAKLDPAGMRRERP